MTVCKKLKTIDKKFEQSNVQYHLDKQTSNISALPSGNVSKYEFLTSEDVLQEKGLLEKVATIKKIEYSPLGSELENKLILQKINTKLKMLLITIEMMMLRQKMVKQ